jgi:hypothetical protein
MDNTPVKVRRIVRYGGSMYHLINQCSDLSGSQCRINQIRDHEEGIVANVLRAVSHPQGWSGLPDYEIRDGKMYRAVSHPAGWSGLPDYEIRGNQIYRTVSHPDGWSGLPDYNISLGCGVMIFNNLANSEARARPRAWRAFAFV